MQNNKKKLLTTKFLAIFYAVKHKKWRKRTF